MSRSPRSSKRSAATRMLHQPHHAWSASTTDTSVPSSTEPDAGSTQASYWRASTNTLSAGGSAAISTAVVDPARIERPEQRQQQRTPAADAATSLIGTRTAPPTASRQRPQRHRHAEREQRAGRRRVLQKLQQPVERDRRLEMQRRRSDAERGRDHERMQHDPACTTSSAIAPTLLCSAAGQRHQQRHQREQQQLSKQKISATGAAACAPSVASASPGPI